MRANGFTLIELVIVIVLLGILAVVAAPKYIDIANDADQSVMLAMKGSLKSAENMVAPQIVLRPDNLSGNTRRFTLSDGQSIRVRKGLPDGFWDRTFVHLVDFEDITPVTGNVCTDDAIKWCVTEKPQGWFNAASRGYANLGVGRGFVIFPNGKNVNQDKCYVYYMNQNNNDVTTPSNPSIVGTDFSEC